LCVKLVIYKDFCKDYIKKYEIGESYSMHDIEDKYPVISLRKPERMRKLEDL